MNKPNMAFVLTASVLTAFVCVLVNLLADNQTKFPVRTDLELCAEVEYELNIAAESGLITHEHAREVSERCHKRYGGQS